jgi:hypothetical protein
VGLAVPDLGLISRNRVSRNSAKKPTISVPYTVSIVVLAVVVVLVNLFVMNTGLGTEVVVEIVRLVSEL